MAASLDEISGAWTVREYRLANGDVHVARGLLLLTDGHWATLFFVLNPDGVPRLGSGQGGTFTLAGGTLTLTHVAHVAAGAPIPGAPKADADVLRHAPPDEPRVEICNVQVDGRVLHLHLPSGNIVTFDRAR
ncbi:MAG: hypothetical protein U0Q12_17275 [Vicinamibacterales bacterium]